jgi:pectinesterase
MHTFSQSHRMAIRWLLILTIPAICLAAPTTNPSQITVAPDGSGNFKTIQAAIDSIPEYPHFPYDIHILPGTYDERVMIPRMKSHLHIWGDDPLKTILTFNLGASMPGPNGKPMGTFATPTATILSDNVSIEKLTFQNTFGPHGQALAIEVAGDRDAFDNCRFLGWQDTMFADSNGRNYFHDCFIEGHVDFIFGKSTVVFDHCEIHSKDKGYLTAASTEPQSAYGYVFLHCRLTADDGVKPASVYLGRPWHPYAATAFIDCWMGPHIRPEGWFNWKNPDNEKTARYSEFGSTGPGANPSKRVAWAHQLSPDEVSQYLVTRILYCSDGWIPPYFTGEDNPAEH